MDIRRFPSSRRLPQFNWPELERALHECGIAYFWLGESLGGRRSEKNLSAANSAWRVKGFHAYADYMHSGEFAKGVEQLESLGLKKLTAYICAEAQWTRCHRRLVSDALVIKGWKVRHITSRVRAVTHQLPGFARVRKGVLCYPK